MNNNGHVALLPEPKRAYTPLKLAEASVSTPAPAGIGTWAEKLREAAFDAVKEQDIKDIVEKQVELAKTGDARALKFVTDFLLGGPPKIQVQKVVIKKRSPPSRPIEPGPVLSPRRTPEPSDEELDERCRVQAAEPAMISTPAVKVLRRLAARILKDEGPTAGPALAGQLEIGAEELETVMRCDWFKLAKGSWALTPEGNASV